MTDITTDIQAIQKALEALLVHEDNTGEDEWIEPEEVSSMLHPIDKQFIAACSPDRISRLLSHIQELEALLQTERAHIAHLMEERERDRADAERWRFASTSHNFGISNWNEFGHHAMYRERAGQVIDAAIKEKGRA